MGAGPGAGAVGNLRVAAPGNCARVAEHLALSPRLLFDKQKAPDRSQGLWGTGLLVGFFLAQHNPERPTVRATDNTPLDGDGHTIDDLFGVARVHIDAPKRRPNIYLDIDSRLGDRLRCNFYLAVKVRCPWDLWTFALIKGPFALARYGALSHSTVDRSRGLSG